MLQFLRFIMFWIPSKVILRQYDSLEHVKQDNSLIISFVIIRVVQLLIIENQPANYTVVFLI